MTPKSDADPGAPLLWQWVNLADYRPPTVSVNVVTENWWATLGRRPITTMMIRKQLTESTG